MEFFARNDAVAQMEAALPEAPGAEHLELMVALAWQLRQRDTRRALVLAKEAQTLLTCADLPQLEHRRLRVRLMLVRAEAKWLFADFDGATALAEGARQDSVGLTDAEARTDAHLLLTWIAADQGDIERADVALEQAAASAAAAASVDPVRGAMASLLQARVAATRDPAQIQRGCELAEAQATAHPAARCWAADLLGFAAAQGSDFGQAASHQIQSHALATATGQVRRAIYAATSVGQALASIHEHHSALEWMQRALDLARGAGWMTAIGNALTQTAETMRHLERLDAARAMLREALATMAPMADSRSYANALGCLGDVELDCKAYDAALGIFQALERRATALMQPALRCKARRGQAHALSRLGQPQRALEVAGAALEGADALNQIATLRVLAEIHARHTLPPPAGAEAGRAPLHYLERALQVAASIPGYTIPGDLLEALAGEHAAIGNHEQGYRFACQASEADEKTLCREATERAIAMQVAHQTERTREESDRDRQLAASEARRAEVLERTGAILEQLGIIGQEITAHLEDGLVFEALERHLHSLLDASTVAVYRMDPDGLTLRRIFCAEDGERLPPLAVPLSDPKDYAACCVRERREVLVEFDPDLDLDSLLPGTVPPLSGLFAPLCLADNVLGAMAVQSRRRQAYGPREQLVFGTLCAHAAIALSNAAVHGALAEAHGKMQESQRQLLLKEKMAGLGTLTAGVAHEINNPTNFAHVAAQNLEVDIEAFSRFVSSLVAAEAEEAPEVLAAFSERFGRLSAHVATVLNGTERIKNIVRDLRSFTRFEQAEKKFARLSECLLSTLNLVRASWLDRVLFETEFSDDPELLCWPALLNQVFMCLLVNACQSAAKPPGGARQGLVTIRMQARDGQLLVVFAAQGGTGRTVAEGGMGLATSEGIVHRHGGKLRAVAGQGACYEVWLPMPVAG